MITGYSNIISVTTLPGLLLDLYPNAAAAYSLRKLRDAYTGSAIRVRRSSDNAEQDIGFSSGNLDTSALTTFCSGTNGFVTTWYDQSGNGNNGLQTTAANQPRIVTAGSILEVNGKPTTYFNNANTVCMNITNIETLNFTILWVSKKDTTSGEGSILLSGAFSGNKYIGDDIDNGGNPIAVAVGAAIISIGAVNSSASGNEINQHLSYINRRNSNQAVGQFNNSNNNYNNAVSTNNIIINSIANYGVGYNYLGRVQEIIIYTSDKSADRTPISTNINTHYGIY